jgi:hypothetical protein
VVSDRRFEIVYLISHVSTADAGEPLVNDRSSSRVVNEGIRGLAQWARGELREFVCECGEPGCAVLVRLSAEEYDEVRTGAGRILVDGGHKLPAGTRLVRADERFAIVEPLPLPTAANGRGDPLRVRVRDERHAALLAHELGGLPVDCHRYDGVWEVTVESPSVNGTVVRVLNAVSTTLAGEPAATALVLLGGREYEIRGQ